MCDKFMYLSGRFSVVQYISSDNMTGAFPWHARNVTYVCRMSKNVSEETNRKQGSGRLAHTQRFLSTRCGPALKNMNPFVLFLDIKHKKRCAR